MKSLYWHKLHHSWLDDPRIGMLPTDSLRLRYLQLYTLASKQQEDGLLPPTDHIAYSLRPCTIAELEADLAQLSEAALVRRFPNGRWLVVSFASEQARTSDAERQAMHRLQERAKTGAPYPEQEAEAETEESQRQRQSRVEAESNIVTSCDNHVTENVTSCDSHDNNDDHRPSSDAEEVIQTWKDAHAMQTVTALEANALTDVVGRYGSKMVLDAIWEAAATRVNGDFSIKYVQTILSRWARDGQGVGKREAAFAAYNRLNPHSRTAELDAWAEKENEA